MKEHGTLGTSLRKCAFKYRVPKSTLITRNKCGNLGFHGSARATHLSDPTERLLVHMLQCFGDWGFGLTFTNVKSIIVEYLTETGQQNLFVNGAPTKHWWYSFIKRWKAELSIRKADNLATNRASSCTSEVVNKYFENCKKQFDNANIDHRKSSHVWNCDECGFSADQGNILIVCRRGTKRPFKLTGNNEKIHYTVNNCCNA